MPTNRSISAPVFGILAFASWLLVLASAIAQAQPALPADGAAVHELANPTKRNLDARNWRLDPAVFTEITPFTAPDIAIQLPPEQREQPPTQVPQTPSTKQDQ